MTRQGDQREANACSAGRYAKMSLVAPRRAQQQEAAMPKQIPSSASSGRLQIIAKTLRHVFHADDGHAKAKHHERRQQREQACGPKPAFAAEQTAPGMTTDLFSRLLVTHASTIPAETASRQNVKKQIQTGRYHDYQPKGTITILKSCPWRSSPN